MKHEYPTVQMPERITRAMRILDKAVEECDVFCSREDLSRALKNVESRVLLEIEPDIFSWGRNAVIGGIYAVNASDNARIGICWASGRLIDGDLVICLRHSGDCFSTYMLLCRGNVVTTHSQRIIKADPPTPFGAYDMGRLVEKVDYKSLEAIAAGDYAPMETPYGQTHIKSEPRQ